MAIIYRSDYNIGDLSWLDGIISGVDIPLYSDMKGMIKYCVSHFIKNEMGYDDNKPSIIDILYLPFVEEIVRNYQNEAHHDCPYLNFEVFETTFKDIEKYGHDERMNIIAGIFDSARSVRCDDFVLVNCGTSLEYLTKFISLIRSFGYGAQIIFGKEMRVKVYVSKTFGELPQKVLTPPIPYVDTLDKVFIEKVEETFAIPGRKIYVERNCPILVGYGFIPIRP